MGYRAVASHTARGRVSPRWHESVSVHSTPVAANPPRACAMWRGGGARLQLAFSGREGPKPRMAPTPEHAGSEPRRQYDALCVPADGRSPSTCARRQPPRPPAGQFAGRFPGRQRALPTVYTRTPVPARMRATGAFCVATGPNLSRVADALQNDKVLLQHHVLLARSRAPYHIGYIRPGRQCRRLFIG